MSAPVAVGLVGAGPWAGMVHAPVLAAGPETRLAGIWARRPEAARDLAAKHGAPVFARYEELLDACEAVAFSIAPAAQPEYAITAARAGKALLLEKPLADTLEGAERLAAAVREAGVPSMLMLSYRFGSHVRAFLERAADFGAVAGRATFLGGGFLPGSPFATGWRLEQGALLDLGPHMIDLMEATLGPVAAIEAAGALKVVNLLLRHESGATSTVALSGALPFNPAKVTIDLYGPGGELSVDALAGGSFLETFATVRREFAATVRSGRPHALDAERGLHLQRLIATATAQLA
ncbi:MAG: Gfo/Idh/MocA family protein [Dehalococcoidia bacterium]